MWLKLSRANFNFYGLDKILTKWKKLDKSLSSNTFQKFSDGFKVYNNYMGFNKIKSLYHLMLLSVNFLKKKYHLYDLYNFNSFIFNFFIIF